MLTEHSVIDWVEVTYGDNNLVRTEAKPPHCQLCINCCGLSKRGAIAMEVDEPKTNPKKRNGNQDSLNKHTPDTKKKKEK